MMMGRDYHTGFRTASRQQRRRQFERRRKRRRKLAYALAIGVIGLAGWGTSGWWTHAFPRVVTNVVHPISAAQARETKGAPTPESSKFLSSVSSPTKKVTPDGRTSWMMPASALISVAAQNQNPQLPNGCEVTSVSMLLQSVGHPVNKITLAKEQPYDTTPRVKSATGQILKWGNPNVGFVGSPYVWADGFGIYHGPIVKLIDKILSGQAVDLTHHPFENLLSYVAHGRPVVAWTTATLKPTHSFWVTWQSPEGPVHTTLEEHAVLIVGYDKTSVYINNPLTGQKDQKVSRKDFIAAWNQLGQQAVTIKL